ncbi:MAG: NADH-quinone oxidoreductase subunit C [Chloroflexota bacterium]
MESKELLQALEEVCPGEAFETDTMPEHETVVDIPATCLPKVVAVLSDKFSVHHLSTITGQDRDGRVELLYHFWQAEEVMITLRFAVPRAGAQVKTLTDIIPGADFYEREVGEMLGVTFEGHPGPEHLLLPEDWEGDPPLLEDPSTEEDDA